MLPEKAGLWLFKWALTDLGLQGNSADGEDARDQVLGVQKYLTFAF